MKELINRLEAEVKVLATWINTHPPTHVDWDGRHKTLQEKRIELSKARAQYVQKTQAINSQLNGLMNASEESIIENIK